MGRRADDWATTLASGRPVRVRPRRRKQWRILVTSSALTSIGVAMTVAADNSVDRAAGGVTAVFFGLVVALAVFSLVDRRPSVVVDAEGIGAPVFGTEVPWREALGAEAADGRGIRILTRHGAVPLPGPLAAPADELVGWLATEIRRRNPSVRDVQP